MTLTTPAKKVSFRHGLAFEYHWDAFLTADYLQGAAYTGSAAYLQEFRVITVLESSGRQNELLRTKTLLLSKICTKRKAELIMLVTWAAYFTLTTWSHRHVEIDVEISIFCKDCVIKNFFSYHIQASLLPKES